MTKSQTAEANNGGIAVNNNGGEVSVTITALSKVTSLLNPLLIKIIEAYKPEELIDGEIVDYPGVDEKLEYNAVAAYAEDIREHSGYMGLIEALIESIDNEDPGAKSRFLWAIQQKYKQAKKELLIEGSIRTTNKSEILEFIKNNSDKILLKVSKLIDETLEGFDGAAIEIVHSAKELIVCYGFINCKILEPPT